MISSKQKKRTIAIVLAVFLATNLLVVPKAQALLGVADISVVTTAADIPRVIFQIGAKIAKVFFQQLRKRFVTMLQNDLVNWVQGGGRPRFITNPQKIIQEAADQALVSSLDQFFTQHGKDICSSFRPQLQLLVQQASFVPEFGAKCTLGSIANNLQNFSRNFNDGGWETWISLHQTQNTLPGSYLAGIQTIRAKTVVSQNSVQSQISAGKGFLDQKNCLVYQIKVSSDELLEGGDFAALSPEQKDQFAASGFVTENYTVPDPNGIPMSQVPQNATCIEEETITPGSVIGEQISGSLKSTGIDKLINAQEIAEIIDAVIDAGVNRVAREGLSLVKSGRGSYTKPARPITRLAKPAALDANRGSEGAVGIELLNKVVAYKTKTEKLINTMARLVIDRTVSADKGTLAEGNKGAGGWLRTTLRIINPGYAAVSAGQKIARSLKNIEYIFSSEGENKTNLSQIDVLDGRLNYIFERVGSIKCSEKEKTAGKIERCFFYGNAINFNEEDNNPGPLEANKLLHRKMAEKWGELTKTLAALKGRSDLTSTCKVPDIRYTLNPNEPDLPFTISDGTVFEWTKDAYQNAIDTNKVLGTDAQNWKNTYLDLDAIPNAEIQQEQNKSMVDTYNQLISNANATVESLRQDVDFAITTSQNIILYAGILMDFDKAGRTPTIKLADSYKKYTDALNKGDMETALTVRNGDLFFKFADTTGEWVKIQNDIINSADTNTSQEEKDKAAAKLRIINEALRIIKNSSAFYPSIMTVRKMDDAGKITLVSTPRDKINTGDEVYIAKGEKIPIDGIVIGGTFSRVDESSVTGVENDIKEKGEGDQVLTNSVNIGVIDPRTGKIDTRAGKLLIRVTDKPDDDPNQLWTSPSEAVSQAMINLKMTNQSMDQISDELDARDARITRVSSDIANQIGKFPTDKEERVQLGLDGGDSEWEKYFKNRQQFVYLSMINDFYKKYIKCQN